MAEKVRWMMVVAALLMAGGCGGGDDGAQDRASTSTTEQVSSVEHIATAIAQSGPEFQETAEQISACFTLDSPGCTSTIYGLNYLSLQLEAQTLALNMQNVADPGVAGYQGPVPDEIAELYNDTFAAAQQLDYAMESFNNGGCVDITQPNCSTLNTTVQIRADQLSSLIDAWSPYL
mgnify:CR=1 FL=1